MFKKVSKEKEVSEKRQPCVSKRPVLSAIKAFTGVLLSNFNLI
jgi:hypothetical protein